MVEELRGGRSQFKAVLLFFLSKQITVGKGEGGKLSERSAWKTLGIEGDEMGI